MIASPTERDKLEAGVAAHRGGSAAEAERLYREVLAAEPGNADALHLLGVLVGKPGRAGGFAEALPMLTRAVDLDPAAPHFRMNLGSLLGRMERPREAVEHFRSALRLRPDYAEAAENLALALGKLGRWPESADACRLVIALRPGHAPAHHHLGDALRRMGRPVDAAAAHRRAIALAPDRPEALAGLAADCGELGLIAEAVECHRKIVELRPKSASAGSDYLHVLHYDHGVSRERLLEEAKGWARRCAGEGDVGSGDVGSGEGDGVGGDLDGRVSPLAASQTVDVPTPVPVRWTQPVCDAASGETATSPGKPPPTGAEDPHPSPVPEYREREKGGNQRVLTAIDSAPARPLRVGFASPDFREHPVARLIEPILTHLDRGRFQTFCYSDEKRGDEMTRRIKAVAGTWRETAGMSNGKLADLIRQDRIDILVDIAGHMGGNRLPMFARRAAQVQVTHFNYPDTTGLAAMDWRITDDLAEPPGGDDGFDRLTAGPHDRFSTERLARLPKRGWCYQPTADSPGVGPLPALKNGYVTFTSLNKPVKHSPPCIALWARVLAAVPGSKLMLLGFEEPAQNAPIVAQFAPHGIGPERLRFVTRRPRHKYLALFNEADAGLDPFPYNGGVTSCDSLWMGVPFVTLEGNSYMSRQGLMLLTNVGLPKLVARSEQQYVGLAAAMAGDLNKLSAVRACLRERFGRSPIADGPGFARDLGEAFLRMWGERGKMTG